MLKKKRRAMQQSPQEIWREEKLSSSAFRGVRVTVDKYTRALAWANRAEAGKIVLVRGPWINDFLDEVCHFPNAAHAGAGRRRQPRRPDDGNKKKCGLRVLIKDSFS